MMQTQFSTSPDGTRIAYDVSGQGPALMLLHGAGKTRQDWHRLGYVARLQSDFTVITVDLRGSGESDYLVQIEDYAIEKICADLLAVADACGVERFALWGFSLGGNLGRYLAAGSDRVTALAVIGVPFGPAVDAAFERQIAAMERKYGHLAEAGQAEIDPKKKRTPIKGQMAGWLACFRAMRAWPVVDPQDLRCPALLVVGTKNQNTLRWVQAHQAELDQTGVGLRILTGLAHSQEFTEFEQVFPVVAPFFQTTIR